jgi:DNA mismatch endonuclease (patch repair protein)
MSDVFTRAQRSEIMSKIKSRGNVATELRLVSILRGFKIVGWRRSAPIFGKPDFVFSKTKLAIFVDGCFWHGCPIHGAIPDTNKDFWRQKLDRNLQRDKLVGRELRKLGWRVVRIWQHELSDSPKVARKINKALSGAAHLGAKRH